MLMAVAAGMFAAGAAAGEDTEAFVAARIAALNKTPAAVKRSPSYLAQEIELLGGEKKRVDTIKAEIAMRGVSIRLVDGRYVDVSNEVVNGHALEPKDRTNIALMNHLHQDYCMIKDENYLPPGEAVSHIDSLKRMLEARGIRLKLKGDLFVVDCVLKRKGDALTVDSVWK